MIELLKSIPSSISGWVFLIGMAVVGSLAVYGLYDKARIERRRSDGSEDDRLINILQGTVDELEKKVNKQIVDIELLTVKVQNLSNENAALIKVLQGRDEQTQEFYRKGFIALKKIDGIAKHLKIKVLE